MFTFSTSQPRQQQRSYKLDRFMSVVLINFIGSIQLFHQRIKGILMIQSQLQQELLEIHKKNQELAAQLLAKQIISLEELDKILIGEQNRLGEILVKERLVLKYELDQALQEQKMTQKKLGEILVEKRVIFPFQLERVLRRQG